MKTKLITLVVVALFGLFSANTAHAQLNNGSTANPASSFSLKAYPSPTSDILNISTILPKVLTEPAYFEVLSFQGQVLQSFNCMDCGDATVRTINVKNFPAGMYIVRVTYKGMIRSVKFVKIDG